MKYPIAMTVLQYLIFPNFTREFLKLFRARVVGQEKEILSAKSVRQKFSFPTSPRKNTAEEGCGGNSAVFLQKIEASPAALLVQSRTPKKSFVFLLEEKIRRAQIRKCEQNFSLVWRALASGGGLASLVSSVQNRFGLGHIIAPQSNFPIFARPIRPREARKGMETLARRAQRGSSSAGSKSLAILSICFAQ